MKKLIIALGIVAASLSVHAQHRMPHYSHEYNNGSAWVVPALIGGMIVYGATRPEPAQQIVYVTPPQPVVMEQRYAPPIVTSEEPLYKKIVISDPACNCLRQVYVPVERK